MREGVSSRRFPVKMPSFLRSCLPVVIALSAFATMPLRSFSAEPLLGVYGGNSMQRVLDFEAWLGRPVDLILCTVDYFQWQNYSYVDWLSQTVYGARGNRRLVYDTPIIITGANYASAKTGAYDTYWRSLAQSILANNPGTYEVVIRPSHEMNGDWFPWGVGLSRLALIPDFIASWQRFHGVFRGVTGGSRFRFSFSASEGASDPRPMWPGDTYVDLVGYDVYWKPTAMGSGGWETSDPAEAWQKRIASNGYNAWNIGGMLAFAQAKGKPFQIDEWGVWGPNAASFVQAMAAFLRTNGARAHTYWDSDSAYPGELHSRNATWPLTTAAFRTSFGGTLAENPHSLKVGLQTGVGAVLTYDGSPLASFLVQRSTSLAGWIDLENVAATGSGAVSYTDANPPTGRAFYRLQRMGP
jgi:hypothetical protein